MRIIVTHRPEPSVSFVALPNTISWGQNPMSAYGTFRTLRDVRLESGMRSKADVRPTPLNLWVHALNTSQEQPRGTTKGAESREKTGAARDRQSRASGTGQTRLSATQYSEGAQRLPGTQAAAVS